MLPHVLSMFYVYPTFRVLLCFFSKLFRVCLSCLTFAEGGHIVTDMFKAGAVVLLLCNFFDELILILFFDIVTNINKVAF